MKINKIVVILLTGVIVSALLSSYLMFQESFTRTAMTVRDVTLYDTSVTSYTSKNNTVINTKGYFLDKSTNLKFTASIQDKLYREFQEGKGKPIDIQRAFSLDNIENKSDGLLMKLCATLLLFMLVGGLGCVIIINLQAKNNRVTAVKNHADSRYTGTF